jgi:hypothetical protein
LSALQLCETGGAGINRIVSGNAVNHANPRIYPSATDMAQGMHYIPGVMQQTTTGGRTMRDKRWIVDVFAEYTNQPGGGVGVYVEGTSVCGTEPDPAAVGRVCIAADMDTAQRIVDDHNASL